MNLVLECSNFYMWYSKTCVYAFLPIEESTGFRYACKTSLSSITKAFFNQDRTKQKMKNSDGLKHENYMLFKMYHIKLSVKNITINRIQQKAWKYTPPQKKKGWMETCTLYLQENRINFIVQFKIVGRSYSRSR